MDIGIDFGTTTARVYVKGRGVVLQEPSVVAVRTDSKQILATGCEAEDMLGRSLSVEIAHFVRNGVIANVDMAAEFLRACIDKVCMGCGCERGSGCGRLFVAVPIGCTEVERQAFEDIARKVGFGDVLMVENIVAAAIGEGIPIAESESSMIVDTGGGKSEAAVILHGGVVHSCCSRSGGNAVDRSIRNYLRWTYDLIIGDRTAELIKKAVGLVAPMDEEKSVEVSGRCAIRDLPKLIEISSQEIREVILKSTFDTIDGIREMLDRCEPELVADFVNKGLVLTGGAALLRGLDRLIERQIGLSVCLAKNPFTSTIEGVGKIIEDPGFLCYCKFTANSQNAS